MGPKLRTLVVDDDPDTRFLLGRGLAASGHFEVVGEAGNGRDAVTVASRVQPDVVVMDLNMPEVDGLTALPMVRSVCPPHALIVAVSGVSVTEETQETARSRGAAAFLVKDPDWREFAEHLFSLSAETTVDGDGVRLTARWELPADLRSGATARQHLREVLQGWKLFGLLDEAELLATELINNAVVHAQSSVHLQVTHRGEALRIEVSDSGMGDLNRPDTGLDDTHGRGLMLVEAMSDSWGTAVTGDTKTVWFELATTSGLQPSDGGSLLS